MKNRFYLLMIFLFLILGCKFEGTGKHGGCVYRVIDDNSVSFYGWTAEAIKKSKGNMHIPEKIYYFDVVAVENGEQYTDDTDVRSIVMPPTVKTIYGLPNKSDKTLEKIELSKGLIAIGRGAFCCYERLKNIDLPEGLTSMGEAAFSKCYSLSKVTLPSSLKKIPIDAFSYCRCLENIDLPEGLTIIENSAFEDCDSLQDILLPNTLIGIGWNAFDSCDSLKDITLPASLIVIGGSAFKNCKNLNSVIFKDTAKWYLEKEKGSTWIPIDVSDPVKNAENLRKYDHYYMWRREY